MYNHQDLVRAHHEQFVRDSLQLSRSRRLVAARKARRRAERQRASLARPRCKHCSRSRACFERDKGVGEGHPMSLPYVALKQRLLERNAKDRSLRSTLREQTPATSVRPRLGKAQCCQADKERP